MRLKRLIMVVLIGACGGDTSTTKDTTGADTVPDTSAAETTVGVDTVDEVAPDTVADTIVDTVEDTGVDTLEDTDTSTSEDTSVDTFDDTIEDTDTSTGPALGGPCALADRVGGFAVVDDGEYGYISGEVADAVLPVAVLAVVTTSGECTLYRKENPFCEPPCGPGDTCDYDGACIPYPIPQDLGDVTVSGLEGGNVDMNPLGDPPIYYATEIPYPPWQPGAAITIKSTGGVRTPLDMTGVGPQTFSVTDTAWTIQRGQPLTAHWAAPSGPVDTRVELQLLIDQHGNAPASVKCDFDDDGEAEVPVAIINALLDSGVSGFPSGRLTRQTFDSMAIGAFCADFAVRAPRNVKITVSGHTPCLHDNQCPSGQTCDEAIETCVDP